MHRDQHTTDEARNLDSNNAAIASAHLTPQRPVRLTPEGSEYGHAGNINAMAKVALANVPAMIAERIAATHTANKMFNEALLQSGRNALNDAHGANVRPSESEHLRAVCECVPTADAYDGLRAFFGSLPQDKSGRLIWQESESEQDLALLMLVAMPQSKRHQFTATHFVRFNGTKFIPDNLGDGLSKMCKCIVSEIKSGSRIDKCKCPTTEARLLGARVKGLLNTLFVNLHSKPTTNRLATD